MISLTLARRYARAISDLAQEAGLTDQVGEELETIAALFQESQDLRNLFTDPTVDTEKKEKVLETIIGKDELHDLTSRFIHVLLTKGRILGIGEIVLAYRRLADRLANRIRAEVTSAAELTPEERERIRQTLSKKTGSDVVLEVRVDESLLGGVVTRVGSQVYDGSLKNQLEILRDSLSKGR